MIAFLFQLTVLSFYLFSILLCILLMYDASNPWDAIAKFETRKERKRSRKEGLSVHFGKLASSADQYGSYILIDARPDLFRKKLPITNAINTPEDLTRFSNTLPLDTAVFVCSNFGKESYLVCRELTNLGIEKCFDLGGIKGRVTLINRAMIELSYQNIMPLDQDEISVDGKSE